MEKYTVKQISDMLHTNPETVRRWIRSGKLKSQIDSTKGGNIILKSDLEDFVSNTPKYADSLPMLFSSTAASIALMHGTSFKASFGIGTVAAIIANGTATVLSYVKSNMDNKEISKQELTTLLSCAIAEKKQKIEKTKELLEAAKRKLSRYKQELEELESLVITINIKRD